MLTSVEERVAYLEGKVEEHSKSWQDLKDVIIHIDGRMIHLEQRITELDARINQRITEFDSRINQRITELDARINQRIDKLFFFILATLASSIGSLITAIITLVTR
jgi:predicted  nucleic acid-binding Zn-ribbon protein